MKSKVLYISYDGVMEPIGQSQVLPYIRLLALTHEIVLLTFEKGVDLRKRQEYLDVARSLREAGITWRALRYHKAPSVAATAYDVLAGFLQAVGIYWAVGFDFVHARSYIPSIIALMLKRLFGLGFIFDIRGFWADQRLETGAWRQGAFAYHVAKALERRFFSEAGHVVSLTRAAAEVISNKFSVPPERISVIPTCVDTKRFCRRPTAARTSGIVVGCVGTVTVSYRFDEMLQAFLAVRAIRPEARLLILNRGEHPFIGERLAAMNVPAESVDLREASSAEIPNFMSKIDLGLFFLRVSPSFSAVAPTKLAEFLASGIPCLSNAGVGDFEAIFRERRVGIAIQNLSVQSISDGVAQAVALAEDPDVGRRCVDAATEIFSLDAGVAAYQGLYVRMARQSC